MGDLKIQSRVGLLLRRSLLLIPATLAAQKALPQLNTEPDDSREPNRLPNGKLQQDEILKAEFQSNLKDAQDLVNLARSFEEDLEKDDRFVLSLTSLKKLDEMEKLTKRIRGRLKH